MRQNNTGAIAPWVQEEMATAHLQDQRLNRRLRKVLSDLGDRPAASIPAACGGHAEMTAAYRFFDNPKVTSAQVLEPHFAATRQRLAAQPVAVLVPDTSELQMTRPSQQVVGAGPLDGGTRRGALVHPVAVFTPDGTPLGTVAMKIWTRPESARRRSRQEKDRRRQRLSIEQKESFRWLQSLRTARVLAQELPQTQIICVMDSEADIYALFAEPRGERPVEWVIRARRNRPLGAAAGAPKLRESLLAQPVLFTQQITVRERKAKTASETRPRHVSRRRRTAEVQVRAATVTLRPPRRSLPAVMIQAVLASEPHPPAGTPAVEWLLLTTLPIQTVEQVRQILHYYTVRWMIEVLFRTWKSGGRAEERRFEHITRWLPCLALYWIIAWRVLLLSRLGQSDPALDCEALLEPSEWQAVWRVTQPGPLPRRPPPLGVMVRLIAQLGGYVNRPHQADPPGPQTLWLGLQRMQDLAWAWNTFGPGARHDPGDV